MTPQLESGPPTVEQLLAEVERLQSENDRLTGVNARLQTQASEALKSADKGARAVHALGVLRKELGPIHRAMSAIFGELDAVGVQDADVRATPGGGAPSTPAVWQSWKNKFGADSYGAKFIDALLDQGSLTVKQLQVHMHAGQDTVYKTASKLGQLQLVINNGGKYSLRQLG